MYKVLQATYNNGNLILKEKLSNEWEGKNFQIIILETDEIEVRKKRFFDFVDQHHFTLPEDYQLNREEIYNRNQQYLLVNFDSRLDVKYWIAPGETPLRDIYYTWAKIVRKPNPKFESNRMTTS